MKLFASGRILVVAIVLVTIGSRRTYCMQTKDYQLNIPSFLCSIKRTFFIPSYHIDFIVLKAVLVQYHPNAFGNITGKNLVRLRRMAEKTCEYYASGQLYHKLLKQICMTIDQLPVIDNDGSDSTENSNEIETCNVCGDNEREAIAISCKHIFCYECLFRWYVGHKKKNDCHYRCPCCRSPLHKQIIKNIKNDERYQKVRTKVLIAHALEEEQERAEAQDYSSGESSYEGESEWESLQVDDSLEQDRDC